MINRNFAGPIEILKALDKTSSILNEIVNRQQPYNVQQFLEWIHKVEEDLKLNGFTHD